MTRKTKLKLLFGGKAKHVTINGVKVSVAPNTLYPLPVDARVFEEDTHLVLTVDPVMRYTPEHPIRMLNILAKDRAKKPGTVVHNGASWYAVVHDLDLDPTSRREWVVRAYEEIFRLTEEDKVVRIGIPLLGSVHGNMKSLESLGLLLERLRAIRTRELKHIMIIVPPAQVEPIKTSLLRTVQ
ncbi:MAG: hypothetical protein ACYC9M_11340 [Desulfobulbaceae bacterium]